jgi:murein DD-endopeptidase MepM/ murein hydrolase activator NlpD
MHQRLSSLAVGLALAAVPYRPPVDAPVIDPFRAPPTPWAAGNRGLEYRTEPGTPVHAAADGDVVFAGAVAGALHVVVLHADGMRTTYSFLQTIAVHRGDTLGQGEVVGTSGTRLHFGARVGDTYVDPAALFRQTERPRVWLVPDDDADRPRASDERTALLDAPWLATRPELADLLVRTGRALRAVRLWN